MKRFNPYLLACLLSLLSFSALAQKAGTGADQISSIDQQIEGFPTEYSIGGMPVNIHGQTTYINQRYNNTPHPILV